MAGQRALDGAGGGERGAHAVLEAVQTKGRSPGAGPNGDRVSAEGPRLLQRDLGRGQRGVDRIVRPAGDHLENRQAFRTRRHESSGRLGTRVRLAKAVALDARSKRAPRNPQVRCRAAHIPVVRRERSRQELGVVARRGNAVVRPRVQGHEIRQLEHLAGDDLPTLKQGDPLHHVAELSDVAGKGVRAERGTCVVRERLRGDLVLRTRPRQEPLPQEKDVVSAVAERRKGKRHHGKAMEERLEEPTFAHHAP